MLLIKRGSEVFAHLKVGVQRLPPCTYSSTLYIHKSYLFNFFIQFIQKWTYLKKNQYITSIQQALFLA